MAVTEPEKVATFMHAGYSNILRRTEGGRKKNDHWKSTIFSGLLWVDWPFSDPPGARTQDPNIKSVVLYQLS